MFPVVLTSRFTIATICSHLSVSLQSHMDPGSISIGCISLAKDVYKVSSRISSLIKSYRGARGELDVFKKQFDELSTILELLKDDEGHSSSTSDLASEKTKEQINICKDVIGVLNSTLDKYNTSTFTGRALWAVIGKSQVEKLNHELAVAIDHFKLRLGTYGWYFVSLRKLLALSDQRY